MKELAVLCVSFSTTAGFARGGGHGGSHQSSSTGGAAGTSVGSPGTNSAGTALSSGGRGNGPQNGQVAGVLIPSSTVTRRKLTR
jgi:hypothetical protein